MFVNICRSKVLKDMPRIDGRPGEKLAPVDFGKLKKDLQESYPHVCNGQLL